MPFFSIEYMAPEMIRGQAYNHAVDWWALVALIYEMVTGYPPFRHKNRKKLLEKILHEKLSLPKWLQPETHSILKQLLERNVEKRLGSGKSSMFQVRGVAAIKRHPFFKVVLQCVRFNERFRFISWWLHVFVVAVLRGFWEVQRLAAFQYIYIYIKMVALSVLIVIRI